MEEPRRRKQVKRFGEQDLMEYSELETSDSEASEPVGDATAGAPGAGTPGTPGVKVKKDGRRKKRNYRGEFMWLFVTVTLVIDVHRDPFPAEPNRVFADVVFADNDRLMLLLPTSLST